jgi:ABC-2 type transport system permease protein
MRKIWLVAQQEYVTNLKKKSFLFAALGTPLIIVVVFAISIVLASNEGLDDYGQIGYVDFAGAMNLETVNNPERFAPYADVDAARAALDAEDIEAYFVIPEDYVDSGNIQLYSFDKPPQDLDFVISDALARSLSANLDITLPVERLVDPVSDMTVRLLDSGRELTIETLPAMIILPMFFAIVFTLATQVTGGFLMSGMVEEKTNRVLEILITSATPMQILAGKIIGLGLLGLSQLALWLVTAAAVITFGADLEFLNGVTLPLDLVIVAVAYFILGYFLTASLMAGLGSLIGSEQESRQYAGMISLPFAIPYFFLYFFITDPNGTFPVILSMIPFTAPMSMTIRFGLAGVPLWQLILSMSLLLILTLFVTWISASLFRLSLLLYGKKIGPVMLFKAIRGDDNLGAASQPQHSGKKGATA